MFSSRRTWISFFGKEVSTARPIGRCSPFVMPSAQGYRASVHCLDNWYIGAPFTGFPSAPFARSSTVHAQARGLAAHRRPTSERSDRERRRRGHDRPFAGLHRGTDVALVLWRVRRLGGSLGCVGPRIHSAKGGWGFRSRTSSGSVTWSQVNRAPRCRNTEGRSRRARREGRPWVEGTRNR